MKSSLLTWILWDAAIGGGAVTLGCFVAALCRSPVRRLGLLEWTLVAALVAPLLACVTGPWQWSLHWLAPRSPSVEVATTDQTASSADASRSSTSQPFPMASG